MPDESTRPDKFHFFDQPPEALDQLLASWGWPRFRAAQVRDWVYRKLLADPAQMTNLSLPDRDVLSQRIDWFTARIAAHQSSADGTQKLLLSWGEPAGSVNAETVMIPDADRRTACLSSQVGCPVGCKFCASGLNGMKSNLTAGQIVEQVFALDRLLDGPGLGVGDSSARKPLSPTAHTFNPRRINHVVLMGMGEPLANYANVIRAVRILHHPQCFNIGARKITISTVGLPQRIRQLAEEDLPLNLAISLHAPNEPLRRELIPWAEHFGLDEILDAARYYFERTGREVTLEYVLLSGVNDRPQHARQLVQLIRSRALRANVNLIRYNEVESLPYKRPKAEDVVEFQTILRRAGINTHVRKSRGRDIDAACGQLRRKEQARQQLVEL
jgi:23S rRNA (adenine2503-C2)-methyltransferase